MFLLRVLFLIVNYVIIKNKKERLFMLVDLISCAIALFVVFGIPSLLDKKSSEQRSRDLEEEFRKRENY
jgi:hypothetical protein